MVIRNRRGIKKYDTSLFEIPSFYLTSRKPQAFKPGDEWTPISIRCKSSVNRAFAENRLVWHSVKDGKILDRKSYKVQINGAYCLDTKI